MSVDKQGKGSGEFAVEKNTKRPKENWANSQNTNNQRNDTSGKVKKVIK